MANQHEGASVRDLVDEQTAIRHALLQNGYSPFPCRGKTSQMHRWPQIQATHEMIDEWSDQLKWLTTAVHTGRDRLVGIDVDIDDAEVLEAFIDLLPEDLWNRLRTAPVRFGGGVKEMWLARLAVGESPRRHKETSGKWAAADAGEDEDHKLEIWPKPHKLLALYGARSVEGDRIASTYRWKDGRGPHNTPISDLPEISNADMETMLDCAAEAMQAAGWERVDIDTGGDTEERQFDLVDGMKFESREHGSLSLAELTDLCGVYDTVRLYGWAKGKRRRPDRCMARLNINDGAVQIMDFDTGVLHRPAEVDVRQQVARLAARLTEKVSAVEKSRSDRTDAEDDDEAATDSGGSTGLSVWERLQAQAEAGATVFTGAVEAEEKAAAAEKASAVDARADLIERMVEMFAYWSDGSGYVVEIGQGPETAMTVTSFKNRMLPLSWEEKKSSRANAKAERVNPADLWLCHEDRRDVGGFRFLPMSRERLVQVGGREYLNTWERPAWWDDAEGDGNLDGGAVEVFESFLEHLIPCARERAWFLDWLAAKVQKPWLPNCGVVMVAEPQGTGRGTLFDILKGVFGGRHVKNVAAVQLIGGGSQSQYTDWLEQALLITCDEVLAGDDTAGTMAWKRREVYERLKALIDPRPRSMQIVRKGLPNYESDVYASFLLATNNANALPLSQDDRRIAVITNTGQTLLDRPDIMGRLKPWRTDVGFSDDMSAALYRWLRAREVAWEDVRESPRWMIGRERMLTANEGDLEGVLENVLAEIPGDYILANHLRDRLSLALQASGLEGEIKGWWSKTQDLLGRLNRMGWRKMSARQRYQPARAGSASAYVFYRNEAGVLEAWERAALADRVDLWKPGSDLNNKMSRLADTLKERGMSIVDGGSRKP